MTGHCREKWKGEASYRPQPLLPHWEGSGKVASHLCLHILFPFFLPWSLFPLSPFLPLFFPRLLGRLEKYWRCYQCPAFCHHLAGLRVRSREGQKKQGSCLGVFVCSLAGTMPSLKKQTLRFIYLIIIKNLYSEELSKRKCLQSAIMESKWESGTVTAYLIYLLDNLVREE